jgi:hypothetical protein
MHHLIACIFCGGDPTTDTFLLQTAIAGSVAAPWMLRGKVRDLVGKARRQARPTPGSDGRGYPDRESEDPSTSRR